MTVPNRGSPIQPSSATARPRGENSTRAGELNPTLDERIIAVPDRDPGIDVELALQAHERREPCVFRRRDERLRGVPDVDHAHDQPVGVDPGAVRDPTEIAATIAAPVDQRVLTQRTPEGLVIR